MLQTGFTLASLITNAQPLITCISSQLSSSDFPESTSSKLLSSFHLRAILVWGVFDFARRFWARRRFPSTNTKE
jgi:hypothetical protein